MYHQNTLKILSHQYVGMFAVQALRIEWMSNHMYLRHMRAAQLEGGEGSGRTGLFGTRGTRRKSC